MLAQNEEDRLQQYRVAIRKVRIGSGGITKSDNLNSLRVMKIIGKVNVLDAQLELLNTDEVEGDRVATWPSCGINPDLFKSKC